MIRRPKSRWGFTLIELLVVMAIIGILITISIYVWSSVNERSRDDTRKLNLKQIQGALETYALDNRSYPGVDTSEKCLNNLAPLYNASWQLQSNPNASLFSSYLSSIPVDPLEKSQSDTDCNQTQDYLYVTTPSGTATANGYILSAKLENTADPDIQNTAALNPFINSGLYSFYGKQNISTNYIDPNYFIQGGSTR